MKKYNIFKITMFFLGIGLAMVFHCALPSKAMAYGAPYDGFGINADGSIFAPGGPGYPNLYYNGNQWWPYPPPAYTGPNSNYPYGGFGYQQVYNPYSHQYDFGAYYGYPYSGFTQPSYGWDAYNYMYPSYNPFNYSYQNASLYNIYEPYGYIPPFWNYTPDSNYQWKWDPSQGWQYDLALQWGGYPRGITPVPGGYFIPGRGIVHGIAL